MSRGASRLSQSIDWFNPRIAHTYNRRSEAVSDASDQMIYNDCRRDITEYAEISV
jgi:hypothetical protein